ncbi:cation channel sperm-associated protein 2-like [Amphiura filiformis]|uniref:cation channel sperm-associated protein 2-like n=1 Tax=Amphiura filiformis TaxID=82378 RepID=UPI003B21E6EF
MGKSKADIASPKFDDLSSRAETFRSKLIEDFHLLDSFDEHGRSDAPKFHSKDFQDDANLDKMMLDNPHGLVKFQVYSANKDKVEISRSDRRKNRIKNKNSKNPPLDMWAHYVLETSLFQNMMLLLILTNSIALGIQSEVSNSDEPTGEGLRLALDIFDYCSLFLFMVEIVLKWLDDFINFWKNGWNIFDFIVTVGSFVPEIIAFTAGDLTELRVIVRNLRVFRILRSLKMVSRFRQVRLIALAITKAFNAMTFIGLLFLVFAYIFAIGGIILFDSYTHSTRDDLQYKTSFSSLGRSMVTLIQLFTLDQWYKMLKDIWKVMDGFFSTIYLTLWICIGSFIFRNIFVGIMVNNFQSIRNELFEEVKGHAEERQMLLDQEHFTAELAKQEKFNKARRMTMFQDFDGVSASTSGDTNAAAASSDGAGPSTSHGPEDIGAALAWENTQDDKSSHSNVSFRSDSTMNTEASEELVQKISMHMAETVQESDDWEKTVHDNLELLARTPSDTLWPKDTLFTYFQLMEALQENLQEREDLQRLAHHALWQMFDSIPRNY